MPASGAGGHQLMATCVVGAGPAGLMFCLLAGVRREQRGLIEAWPIVLVDKRATYERTHRLRIDPKPYLAAQQRADHPLVNQLIDFLHEEKFRPAANVLEQVLLELVEQLHIAKQQLAIGRGDGELDLGQLRSWLQHHHAIGPDTDLTVVAADSVSSTTRELVAGGKAPVERVHQTVARLRVEAPALPPSLGPVDQFRLAKLLGSALDYRSNPNGFGEIDLFLSTDEHERVVALGARPAVPVELSASVLESLDAPLFANVVRYVQTSLAAAPTTVSVYSTFRLEHRFSEIVSFAQPDLGIQVFLVGDAAVSLPFFRGMACLMQCVEALVDAHVEMVSSASPAPALPRAGDEYERRVAEIRDREIKTVETRARAVRAAREVTRVSSLSPFPIQTWLLSVRPLAQPTGRLTPRLVATIVFASLAAGFAVLSPQLGIIGLICVPLQAGAGFLYRAGLDDPRGPNIWISRFCRFQVSVLVVAGFVIAVANPFDSGVWIRLGASVGWFVLGLVFVAGMYLAERTHRRPD